MALRPKNLAKMGFCPLISFRMHPAKCGELVFCCRRTCGKVYKIGLETVHVVDVLKKLNLKNNSHCFPVTHRAIIIRAVPSTWVARAYSSSIKLELYFWARDSSTGYFFANAKQRYKLVNLLPKRLSHNYGKNLASPGTMQINSGTVPAIPSGTRVTTITN